MDGGIKREKPGLSDRCNLRHIPDIHGEHARPQAVAGQEPDSLWFLLCKYGADSCKAIFSCRAVTRFDGVPERSPQTMTPEALRRAKKAAKETGTTTEES